jgi:hypothetical protein
MEVESRSPKFSSPKSQPRSTKFPSWAILLLTLLVTGLLTVNSVRADELYGRVRGIVTDKTGAALPGVHLKLTNIATGVSVEADSGTDGSYSFINLQPGTYQLTATKSSFKTFDIRSITVVQNQIYVENVPMELGTVSETLEVEANPVQVESTSIQLGSTLTGQTIVDLPLNGRNWINLQQTLPGVVAAESRFATNFATNGSQAQQNSFLVNGTDTNDLPLNSPLVTPSPDSISEVQMVTNTINPEYGRNSGAVLNAVTKTGTNAFHGTGFEFFRDTSLNASDFFTQKPSVFHQNQFGGTIGGPVWKDHTFFFLSYQGTRFRQAQAHSEPKVLTGAERGGDFSADATSGSCPFGSGVSPIPLQGSSGATQPAGTPWCTLFPNGVIPTADFSSISQNLLSFVPLPNDGLRGFAFSPVQVGKNDQTIARLDHTFSPKDTIWGYWLWQQAPQQRTLPFTGATVPGFGDEQQSHINQATAAWNHTFGTATLNELRFGITRLDFVAVLPQQSVLPSSVGFTGINPQDSTQAGIPRINVRGLFNLGFSSNGPQPRVDTTYQATDNFSVMIGKHALKMGFEGRRFTVANPFFGANNGVFGFNSQGQFSTGLAGADFLLGVPATYTQGSGGRIDATATEAYGYIQDQWRVRSNLTLTLGTGYQVDTPISQNFNNGVSTNCFIPNQQSHVFPTAPLGLNYPGDPHCNKESGLSTPFNHFGPRIGFAYSPGSSGKTSIRGGWGLYYNRHEEELLLQFLGAPPFSITSAGASDVGGSPSFANPFQDIANRAGLSEANKFPFTIPASGAPVDFTTFFPLSINVLDPRFGTPYSMNYNLTVQHELPAKTILSLGYVGAMARKLITSIEGNPITPAGQAACIADPTCNPALGGNLFLIQHEAFPNHSVFPGDVFGSLGTEGTRANSSYNSLQVSLKKAATHGLSFFATYTFSHSIDEGSSYEDLAFTGVRGNNPIAVLDRGDSAFDARHRFVITYSYEFPKIHSNGLLNRVVNGWRISGITTFQTGFPITVGDSGFTSFTCDEFVFYSCWDRPQQASPLKILDPHHMHDFGSGPGNYFFDPTSFVPAAFGTFGNTGRNFFHGPGISNTDVVMAKETKFTERVGVELRFEFFNVFNHTQFLLPDNIAGSPGQGDVQNSGGIFGEILSDRNPRIIQLGAKLLF